MKFIELIFVILVSAFISNVAAADSFREPKQKIVLSKNGKFAVRVIPNHDAGKFSKAEYYKKHILGFEYDRVINLRNPKSPNLVYVTNEGGLITIDDWGREGYGSIIHLYDVSGNIIKSYKLSDFFSILSQSKFRKTVSTINWICYSHLPLLKEDILVIYDATGGAINLNTRNGKYTYDPNLITCK